jgi:hypothetical protein
LFEVYIIVNALHKSDNSDDDDDDNNNNNSVKWRVNIFYLK